MTNPTYTDEQVLKCANTYEGYGEPVCPAMLRSLLADRQRLQAEVEVLRQTPTSTKCAYCDGRGLVRVVVATTPGSFLSPPEDHYDIDVCPSCDGSGEVNGLSELQDGALVAAYDAVVRSCLTRDVKTPETKASIVRAAIDAARATPNETKEAGHGDDA